MSRAVLLTCRAAPLAHRFRRPALGHKPTVTDRPSGVGPVAAGDHDDIALASDHDDIALASDHDDIARTSTLSVSFASVSVAETRRILAENLVAAGLSRRTVEDAVLVMSELLSNALKHARPLPTGRLCVTWSVSRSEVGVQVSDGGGPTRPRAAPAGMSATGGRGLPIVAQVARDWGVLDEDAQTTVWARLGATRAAAALKGHVTGRG